MGKLGDAIRPVSGMASAAPRETSAAARWRGLASCSLLGLVFEIVGWSLLTMTVFANGSVCGSPLSSASAPDGCRDGLAKAGSFGWLFVLVGVGLLWLALRQVWQLTERMRS